MSSVGSVVGGAEQARQLATMDLQTLEKLNASAQLTAAAVALLPGPPGAAVSIPASQFAMATQAALFVKHWEADADGLTLTGDLLAMVGNTAQMAGSVAGGAGIIPVEIIMGALGDVAAMGGTYLVHRETVHEFVEAEAERFTKTAGTTAEVYGDVFSDMAGSVSEALELLWQDLGQIDYSDAFRDAFDSARQYLDGVLQDLGELFDMPPSDEGGEAPWWDDLLPDLPFDFGDLFGGAEELRSPLVLGGVT